MNKDGPVSKESNSKSLPSDGDQINQKGVKGKQ